MKPLKLRKNQNGANPALCGSTEENKKVMVEYLKTVFSQVGQFDPAAVDEVSQRRVQPPLEMAPTAHEIRRAVMATGNGKFGGDAKLPAEYWKALMGDQLLLRYLVEVMDVHCKSGSYPKSVAAFTQAGPTTTELNPAAKLAKASANSWRISRLQVNPKGAGIKSRARYECYKGPATIAAALSAGCRQDDHRWDLKHGFLMLCDPALDSPTAVPGPLASDVGGVVYEEWRHARLVLFFCQKGGTFRFAKIGVVFVFLASLRSCCRLYLCVGCK